MPNARAALAGLTAAVTVAAMLASAGPASARIPQPGHHRHGAAVARDAVARHATVRAADAAPLGTYRWVPPARAVDTRSSSPVAAQGTRTVQVGGVSSVPTSGVAAVAVTITALDASDHGGLSVDAAGAARPATTNLIYAAGRQTTTFAVSRVSPSGALTIFNQSGSTSVDVIVDVSGYYTAGTATNRPGTLHPLAAPARARAATAVAANTTVNTVFGGANGVPSTGVGAVAVAISTLTPTHTGSLVAFAKDNDRPGAPSAQFTAGVSSTAFAIVPTNRYGTVSVHNSSTGTITLVLDVVGWFPQGVATDAGATQPRFPARSVNGSPLSSGGTATVPVAGLGGVPRADVKAVLASVTVASATRSGGIGTASNVTNLQFTAGRTASNLVLLHLDGDGKVRLTNRSSGSLRLYFDIVGFVPTDTLAVPGASHSRYLSDLTENVVNDSVTMSNHGCTDAEAHSKLVLLDVGAQSTTGPELSASHPGVSLTQTGRTVRLTYPDLVSVIDSYLDGFVRCANGASATVAVGTNTSGAWSTDDPAYYSPINRGGGWADHVIDAIAAHNGISVVGANDIEPAFDATQTQAQQWEATYLSHTSRGLIFNGSADGCPDGYGRPNTSCATGWSQRGLFDLASHGGRVRALPQIYGPSFAAQWANIDQSGGGHLRFSGALTEYAVAPTTYSPASGYAALYYAIGTLFDHPGIPVVTDLRLR